MATRRHMCIGTDEFLTRQESVTLTSQEVLQQVKLLETYLFRSYAISPDQEAQIKEAFVLMQEIMTQLPSGKDLILFL